MKKIIRLDASCIKESSCFRRLYLIQEGYTEKKLNHDIHYGSCFHKCVEEYEISNYDMPRAVFAAQELWREKEATLYVKPAKKYLTLAHLTMACQMYCQQRHTNPIFTSIDYLKSPEGKPLVEQKMSIPLYEDDNLLILLQGTIDGLGKIKNGCVVIPDWKTTSSYDIEDYFRSYKLSPQLKTYYYGLNYYRLCYPNSPIGRMLTSSGQIGAFIYGAFLSAGGIVTFERSEIFWFNKSVMDSYQTMLDKLVLKIRMSLLDPNALPPAEGSFNGACVGHRGDKCKFFNACAAETGMNGSSSLVYHFLNQNFKKTPYTPLNFGGGNNKQKEKQNEEISNINSNADIKQPTIVGS